MTLGERIKEARENQGLTQEELAHELAVTVRTIQNYESGNRKVSIDKFIQISEALKVPIGKLITIESTGNNIEKDIYLKAINTFGENQQIIKAIEELGELSTALARHFTKNEGIRNINEEIADVEIMINQLKLIFDKNEIEHFKIIKLDRLKGVVW